MAVEAPSKVQQTQSIPGVTVGSRFVALYLCSTSTEYNLDLITFLAQPKNHGDHRPASPTEQAIPPIPGAYPSQSHETTADVQDVPEQNPQEIEVDENQAEGPNLPEGNEHQEVDFKSKTVSNYLKSIDTEFARLETEYEQLLQDIEKTRRELSTSQRRLIGTQRHIYSLQDHRVHLAADIAGSNFQEVLAKVNKWINKYINPIFDDNDCRTRALEYAKYCYFDGLLCIVQTDPRLTNVAYLPETEEDVVHACIVHWMTHKIFQDDLRQVDSKLADFIKAQVQALIDKGVPLYAVQTWKAQAYYAWIKTTEYQTEREKRVGILATEVEMDMAMFIKQWKKPQDEHQDECPDKPQVKPSVRPSVQPQTQPPVVQSLRSDTVEPTSAPPPSVQSLRNDIREIITLAFVLKEKMMSSREDFTVEFEHYHPLSEDQEVAQTPIDFKWSECLDLTKNRRIVSPSNLGQDKADQLRALFAKTPGLILRKIKDDDTFAQPKIVRKQCLLVESPKPVKNPERLSKNLRGLSNSPPR
ncbi:hypothetical protein PG988_014231 [Apiospora saccharicola]